MSYYHHLIKSAVVPAYGALTTAWIAATSETDTTIISALNTLETDLTTYGLASKMIALYPFVGGTAVKHKYNFMNTAQYQLTFFGGLVHSSTGILPNAINGYAKTGLVPSTTIFTNNQNIHQSYYSRTNNTTVGYEMGSGVSGTANEFHLICKYSNGNQYSLYTTAALSANADSRGHYIALSSPTGVKTIKNGAVTNTAGVSTTNLNLFTTQDIVIFAENRNGTIYEKSSKEAAFVSIGLSLTDGEAANFYTAVQAFQTTLSRQIVSYGALTTAWIAATGETDTTIISALNTLETDLTTYGLTSKIKALYPMVGGSAAKHKFNFLDARDLDAAYRLQFFGGWTHDSNGATGNGTNAGAQTFFNPVTQSLSINSAHLSYYARTGSAANAVWIGNGALNGFLENIGGTIYGSLGNTSYMTYPSVINNLFTMVNRTSNTYQELRRQGSSLVSNATASTSYNSQDFYINSYNTTQLFSPSNCAMASIGSGLTNTEAANFYTAVQAFNTTLSRQV